MEKILKEINRMALLKETVIIGIDGPCASGKTTLAQKLAELTDAQVIHTDDFFLPFEMKTPERMAQAGGNVHYERFASEVSSGIASQKPFEYGVYSCKEGRVTKQKSVDPTGIIIVEGSYSLHPEMKISYDLTIFVEAQKGIRLERIKERNGKEALAAFESKWIPLEDKYFESFGIKKHCDIVIE